MRNVAIVTDSAANLPSEIADRYQIFVVPVLLYMDGREYRDGVDVTPSDVYRYMRESANGRLPKTASPTVGEFFRVYMLAAQVADEIVSIHLSANLSAIIQGAHAARDLVQARVHVVDSHTAAMGCGFAALEAARLAQSGADVNAVIQRAEHVAGRVRVLAMLERLDYLHRGWTRAGGGCAGRLRAKALPHPHHRRGPCPGSGTAPHADTRDEAHQESLTA